jgi:hypothetical protein
LQRKLLDYLSGQTTNQYVIASHSVHILDRPDASVFHVTPPTADQGSRLSRVETTDHRVALCHDLGYLAADLAQANSVVWVEGPSDRLYIRHWLAAEDSALIEGVHYSLMFYGGRLLSHLSATDPEVNDFIDLRRINQWMAIVMDSDRRQSWARPNATKQRVRAAVNEGPGFTWITQGREIENYVDDGVLLSAATAIYGEVGWPPGTRDRFSESTKFTRLSTNKRGRKPTLDADKIKLAHEVAKRPVDLSVLDLQARIRELVRFIREANRLF